MMWILHCVKGMARFLLRGRLFLLVALLIGVPTHCQENEGGGGGTEGGSGTATPAPSNDNPASSCACNPEDNNTGAICANDGNTYSSACDFRLKQGLRADLGIRCVGSCPCDESLIGLGVDCSASAVRELTTPSTGLEFCGTNAVTYNNENMFMCDQVQDSSLAIACPGTCPCNLADCPTTATDRPPLRIFQTPSPNVIAYPPAVVGPTGGYGPRDRPLPPFSPPAAQSGYGNRGVDTLPAQQPSYQQQPWSPLPWAPPVPVLRGSADPRQGYGSSSVQTIGTPNQDPIFIPRPITTVTSAQQTGYGAATGDSTVEAPESFTLAKDLNLGKDRDFGNKSKALTHSAYNPLTEALRSVPFRLFRHLYILVTVASEGMKQIPFQIAKNMQTRLPAYVREVPVQLAEAIQEALAIHFDSLARQVKDTVDAVRTLLDNDGLEG
ncbi:hypothetical protein RvY_05857 [Ramazzottius varieornatus]|uniref:Kazal-like domain-containing protein n=1 Tax=Ramazzottius varieornatus TaxID=947166 RepID=A0A1D1UWI4_RAMVA|nr:hypothetical protein RvY_05857 [Ramazzottius varieornatus]